MPEKWKIIWSEPDYIDVIHCEKFDITNNQYIHHEKFIAFDKGMKSWYYHNCDKKSLSTKNLKCPICKEKMPDYIKFQAMLLADQ